MEKEPLEISSQSQTLRFKRGKCFTETGSISYDERNVIAITQSAVIVYEEQFVCVCMICDQTGLLSGWIVVLFTTIYRVFKMCCL